MFNPKTVQLITTKIITYTLTPNDLNLNDGEARYQKILKIIRRDLTDQRRLSLQAISRSGRLSSNLVVIKSIEAGDQNSTIDPITATNPELHALADVVNYDADAESSNPGQDSRSP